MRMPPCATCPDAGCGPKHDTCEAYQAWSKDREMELALQKKDVEATNVKYEKISKLRHDEWRSRRK